MARSFLPFVLAAALPLGVTKADPSPAAPSPSPVPARNDDQSKNDAPRREGKDGMVTRFRQKIEQMDPKDRERFRANWERWKEMDDKERADWKKRAAAEKDRLKKGVDEAIAKTGLTLTAEQREAFARRYRQERCKIEEQLCKEMNGKRQEKIGAMLEQLKAEFSPAAAASPSPTP